MIDRAGRPTDGILHLYDVFNLKLAADFVVLSGCQTGLGRAILGEGLVGLSRAFMYRGRAARRDQPVAGRRPRHGGVDAPILSTCACRQAAACRGARRGAAGDAAGSRAGDRRITGPPSHWSATGADPPPPARRRIHYNCGVSLLLVHTDRFAEHQTPPGHPERPERGRSVDAVAAAGAARGADVVAPRAATREQLLRVHDADYLRRIAETAGRAAQLDPDTYTSPDSHDIALLAAGAASTP